MERLKRIFLSIFGMNRDELELVCEPSEPEELTAEEEKEFISKLLEKIRESK